MRIGGEARVHPYHNPFLAAAQELDIDPAAAVERVLALIQRAPDAFAEAAA